MSNKHISVLYRRYLSLKPRKIGFSLLFLSLISTAAYAINPPNDLRGTVVRSDAIKWEWSPVSDAVRYQVNVNGSFVAMTNDIFYYSRDLSSGDYTFTIQSVNADGRYSAPSAPSASRTIGNAQVSTTKASTTNEIVRSGANAGTSNLAAPRDPRGTLVRPAEIKWEWTSVSGAQRYEVFVDNRSVGFTNDLFVYTKNLSAGEHTMVVRAVDDNGNQSSNSETARRSTSTETNASNSNDNNNSNNSSNNDSASNSNQSANLDAPRDPRGTRVRAAEIKWEWSGVSGASEYEVIVDGVAERTGATQLYTSDLFAGEHSMSVRAINSSGQFSAASNTAKASTWETPSGGNSNQNVSNDNNSSSNNNAANNSAAILDAPRDVRGTEVRSDEIKWEWSAVIGASSYAVSVDGSLAGTTQDDFLYTGNLSSGEHSVTIAAIDSEGRYSAQSSAARVNLNSSSSNNTVAPPPPETQNNVASNADDTGLIDPASANYGDANSKDGYQLVFSDEFDSGSLNRNRWNTQLRWDGSWNGERYEYRLVNGESQFYVNIFSEDQEHLDKIASVYNPFQFNGNRLAIRSTRNPLDSHDDGIGYGPLSRVSTQQPFLSGAISTYDKFQQKYGYFEARIKIPAHFGTFPAFWLHHDLREWEGTQRTEIDIMENLGHAPHYVYNSFHYFTGVSEGVTGTAHSIKPLPQGQITNGGNFTDDYHVYAAEWKPGYIRFLIDGEQVSEVWNTNVDHEELYIIINMAVGGIWTNLPTTAGGSGRTGNERFPTQNDINTWQDPALEIDYVRVYQAR